MRLATLISRDDPTPIPAIAVADENWISIGDIVGRDCPQLVDVLAWSSRRRQELAAAAQTFSGLRWRAAGVSFLPPVPRPPGFRDFYAFEQHVKTARARRGLEVPPAWYEIPVFYFANPNSLVGDDESIAAPAGCSELDYGVQLGVVIGDRVRNVDPANAWRSVAGSRNFPGQQ